MKRFFLAVALAAVASIIVAGTASADVARYGPQTATFTVTQPYGQVGQWGNVWTHNFTVTVNPDRHVHRHRPAVLPERRSLPRGDDQWHIR